MKTVLYVEIRRNQSWWPAGAVFIIVVNVSCPSYRRFLYPFWHKGGISNITNWFEKYLYQSRPTLFFKCPHCHISASLRDTSCIYICEGWHGHAGCRNQDVEIFLPFSHEAAEIFGCDTWFTVLWQFNPKMLDELYALSRPSGLPAENTMTFIVCKQEPKSTQELKDYSCNS